MTVNGDNPFDMTMMLCEDDAEAFLATGSSPYGFESVASLLDELRELTDRPAPRPSAALEMLLDGSGLVGGSELATRRARRAASLGVTAALVGLVTLGSVGAAAANGGLPRATQDAVADAIEAVTPFTVPHHRLEDRDVAPAASVPSPVASAPKTVVVPAERPRSTGSEAARETGPDTARRTGSETSGSDASADGPGTRQADDGRSGSAASGSVASSGSPEDTGSGTSGSGAPGTSAGSATIGGSGTVDGSAGSSDGGGGSGSAGSSAGSSEPQTADVEHAGSGG